MPSPPRPRALLLAVQLPDVSDADFSASLTELHRLVTTLGYDVVGRVTQTRTNLAPAAVVGEGKLQELADLTGGTGHTGTTVPRKKDKARLRREEADEPARAAFRHAEEDEADEVDDEGGDGAAEDDRAAAEGAEKKVELVAVDHDLSPSQARNLERATGVTVLDRTGVIIEIFHRHARSREARMQVEIARLRYTAPRLRESPTGKERQRGRGAGEAALELDRRRVRDRIAELEHEIEATQREQGVRRAHRRAARRVALVGYTNAGKSSLMRALTATEVYVENKLFATLDTTVRALQPEARPRILVSDTVGFIRKLPHDLVASFKSTLDEACEASLLLHVVDAADPSWSAQHAVTRDVLAEIGADAVPTVLVFNKVDCLADEDVASLRAAYPEAWLVSAHRREDVSWLRERIVAFFEAGYVEEELCIPYDLQRLVAHVHESGRVLEERYEPEGVFVRFRTDAETLGKLRTELAARP